MIIGGVSISTLGPVIGLLVIFFLALLRGWVYVKPVYEALLSDRDYWRKAFFEEQAAHNETIKQISNLQSVGKLQQQLLQSATDAVTGRP